MLNKWKESNPNIHVMLNTFGFGFKLKDKLLKTLSKIGGGEFDFIPEWALQIVS